MKFRSVVFGAPMQFFARFILIMALTGSAYASDISSYIGEQSFHLTDDLGYQTILKRVEEAQSADAALSLSEYKISLLAQLKKINREGALGGQSDGRRDGAELAEQIGGEHSLTPVYPGDFDGPNFKPIINHKQIVMSKAYADGYIYNYRLYARLEFLRRIRSE